MECCRSQWTDKTWKRKQSPIANPELNYLGLSLVPVVIHWLPLHLSWQVKLFNCIFSTYLLLITQKLSSGCVWDLCSRVSPIFKVAYSLEDPSMYFVNALIYRALLLCQYKNVHAPTSTLERYRKHHESVFHVRVTCVLLRTNCFYLKSLKWELYFALTNSAI